MLMYSTGHCSNHSTAIMPDLRFDSTRKGTVERALFDSYRRRSSLAVLPPDITLPQDCYRRPAEPLPLQCLAADALPDSLKEEIERLTVSSLEEYNHQEDQRNVPVCTLHVDSWQHHNLTLANSPWHVILRTLLLVLVNTQWPPLVV